MTRPESTITTTLPGRARSAMAMLAMSLWLVPSLALGQKEPIGSEFQVNTYTTDDQGSFRGPDVASDSAGNFVVVWQRDYGYSVVGQRFGSEGTPLGSEFQVESGPSGYSYERPEVAADTAGNFVVVWSSPDCDGGNYQCVRARQFDSAGTPRDPSFNVETGLSRYSFNPKVASDATGNFVVVWPGESYENYEYYTHVWARRFDSAGTPLDTTEIDVTRCDWIDCGITWWESHDGVEVASDAAGNFMVVWNDGYHDFFGQAFDSAGVTVGSQVHIFDGDTGDYPMGGVAADGVGRFIVVWQGADDHIRGQHFDRTGTTLGAEFQVSQATYSYGLGHKVSADSAGNFVVVWTEIDGDDSGAAVFGRQFDSTGTPLGPDFQVNTYTRWYQGRPSVASASDGDFVVVWSSEEQDGWGSGIFGQRFGTFGCTSVPMEGCRRQTKARNGGLRLKDKDPDKKDMLRWKWIRGKKTDLEDFGDFQGGGTDFAMCIYDASANPQPLSEHVVRGGGMCPGRPCWKEIAANRWEYRNQIGRGNFLRVLLQAAEEGRAKLGVKGKGVDLDMPQLPTALPVTVQFQGSNGECWETRCSEYVKKNREDIFHGKAELCGDDLTNPPVEECDGSDDAMCPGLCFLPGGPNECQCPECGDNAVNPLDEECDGSDDDACPGLCRPPGDPQECQCPVCGDNTAHAPSEECDGSDDTACPGSCLPPGNPNECQCPSCGDDVVNQPSEGCDGSDDAACPGKCVSPGNPNQCQCPICGDNAVDPPSEECDGSDDAACPGLCVPPGSPDECSCPSCGDDVVNQPSEECDGSDDGACGGVCEPDCKCGCGLAFGMRVEVSPDGAHVYAVGRDDNAVVVFARNAATGELAVVEAQFDGVDGVVGMDLTVSAVLSPDGAHVYATGERDDAVVVFSRDAGTGALTFVEAQHDGTGGVDGLNGARGVAVSSDGSHVYVAALYDDAVAVFSRDALTGALTFVERQKNGVGGVSGLNGAGRVTLSLDGAHLYVASWASSSLAVFSRNPTTGALAFVESHHDGVGGITSLQGVDDVTVSPDGASVYTASAFDAAATVFSRNPTTGALTFVEAHVDGVGGLDGLWGARSVAVSPDGAHVYVTGSSDDSVVVFNRDAGTSELTFVERQRNGFAGVEGLAFPRWVTLSSDGAHVYVSSRVSSSVAVFSRDGGTGALTFVEALFDYDGCGGMPDVCGDLRLNISGGEECDDGNVADGDGCSSGCLCNPATTPAVCNLTGNWTDSASGIFATIVEDAAGNATSTGTWGSAPFSAVSTRSDSCATGEIDVPGYGTYPLRTSVADSCNAVTGINGIYPNAGVFILERVGGSP